MASVCCFNVGRLMQVVPTPPAAGVTISGSVGSGGINRRDDATTIQTLLNAVGAKPVLSLDGLVGPKTISAIRTFQAAQFKTADGRVDPGQRTLARLNVLAPSQPIAGRTTAQSRFGITAPSPAAAPAAAAMTPLQAAVEATPRAQFWVNAATSHIAALNSAIVAVGGDMNLVLPFVMSTVNTHFHLDRDPSGILVNLTKIRTVFERISKVLADPGRFYTEGPETPKSPSADATMGGFFMDNVRMTFRTKYPTCGPNCRAAMLVHEGAHFCGGINEINHFAMEFPAPNGQPQDGSIHNYEQMTTSEALRNASSYAAFSIHVAFLQDLRFGASDLSK